MRVLLCLDGSPQSETAAELIAHIDWPAGSTIRLLTAVGSARLLVSSPWTAQFASQVDELDAQLDLHADAVLEEGARLVAGTGATIERVAARDRPATAVLEQASGWPADLVVMGSRGHGRIGSMLLGSVTAEVVDHAPCPVLVARLPRLNRIVLAHDGSAFARHAESLLSAWPMFGSVAVEVVSVAPSSIAWRSSLAPGMAAQIDAHSRLVEAGLDEHRQIAADAAVRLRSAGLRASDLLAQGDPAEGILDAATSSQAELIVMGSHGRTGIARLLLGSVARNVMLHAPCSVLIARMAQDAKSA